MTLHPCTFPHILSRVPHSADPEPTIASPAVVDPSLDDVATIEQFASIDFEPLPPGVELLPPKDEWQEVFQTIGTNLQLAQGTLRKTKAELVAGVLSLATDDDDDDLVARMVEGLNGTAQTLRTFAEIISKAELRWLCAAAVHATSEEGPT